MHAQLQHLAGETVVAILQFLGASDLAAISKVSKAVFRKSYTSRAILYQLENTYTMSWLSFLAEDDRQKSLSDGKVNLCEIVYTPGILRACEIKSILFALASPAPTHGRGYWISTNWVTNAKKYYQGLIIPNLYSNGKIKTLKKTVKPLRLCCRGTDALRPSPEMNADITCPHNDLAIHTNPRSKRRLLDTRSWFHLRKFYPKGYEFMSSEIGACCECSRSDRIAKESAALKLETKLLSRRLEYHHDSLESLVARKSGTPSHLATQKMMPGKFLQM